MKKPLKILLGGVPFGRNNVGDEAILECIVKIVRRICPDAQITVSTDDGPATAVKLNVNTVQLFGFEPPFSRALMEKTLASNDVFIWSGATGLSDYPKIPLEMLEIAQRAGRKTIVWGVGMNNQINPVFTHVLPGLKQKLLKLFTALTIDQVDMIQLVEKQRIDRIRRHIAHALSRADLVVLRDPQSHDEVNQCGAVGDMITGADSALLLEPADIENLAFTESVRNILFSDYKKIGICISAQREISDTKGLVDCFNDLVESDTARIVFVPMNPLTDAPLMAGLQQQMNHPERAVVIEGRYEPSEILAVAAKLDVIASSRLHLLILASIVHVPIVGISRGSKVDNFLQPFGLTPVGSVDSCDFGQLKSEILRMIQTRKDFETQSLHIRNRLLQRLDFAIGQLEQQLNTN
jgi:polysaccharide pyruvyl transferase WcaK-like protein